MKSASGSVLPVEESSAQRPCRRPRSKRLGLGVVALILILLFVAFPNVVVEQLHRVLQAARLSAGRGQNVDFKSGCAQPEPLFPSHDADLDKVYDGISGTAFRNASIGRLSGAVRVKTESFDDLGPIGEDARWDVFYAFHQYLETAFPLMHKELLVEKVNTHGLLYTWNGTDSSLKPTLLMAHQDTVPVPPETIGAWTYPPWSGAYDGTHIWGRGASDCKNQLIALMETLELLLEAGFAPKRTIILSFGFDEECSGPQGGAHLAAHIRKRYGSDGIAAIVDEGSGFESAWGTLFARPGTAEKGYIDAHITVRMPGGHSSVPSDHTSIGILSELITRIEAGQYRIRLVDENPYYTQLQCGAAYSPEFPSKLKKLLGRRRRRPSPPHHDARHGSKPDHVALEAAKQGPEIQYLMQTSQAVDVIAGGIKVNALPERATAVVNHRINIGETPRVVKDRLAALAGAVARRHNLTLHAFDDQQQQQQPERSIMLTSVGRELEVAPVTPADDGTDRASPFSVVAGTVRALYGEHGVVVTPGLMTGNTDTRHYWDLTRHIFRFAPGFDPEDGPGLGAIHTVDERVSVRNHINAVKWFMLFVRNMDGAEL